MREKTTRIPRDGPHAGLTSSFPQWRVAIVSSRRKNSGRIGIPYYVLHIGIPRDASFENIDARYEYATSDLLNNPYIIEIKCI